MTQSFSDDQMQNFVSELTDALFNDDQDIETVFESYEFSSEQTDNTVRLIKHIQSLFKPAKPDSKFTKQLQKNLEQLIDIMDEEGFVDIDYETFVSEDGLRQKIFSPRIQIAAVIALVAGVTWYTGRRFLGGDPEEAAAV